MAPSRNPSSRPRYNLAADGDLALGDFNNDGRMDAAVADQLGASTGNLSVFAGNGDGTLGFRASLG